MISKYLKDNALEDMKTELKLLETISDKSNQLVNIEIKKLQDEKGDRDNWSGIERRQRKRTHISTIVNNNADVLRDVKMLRNFIVLSEKLLESEVA